ncbi:DUF1127 domain-containing protein [bacterium]|nr:DUF1127 domain-containing protein [bacterium]
MKNTFLVKASKFISTAFNKIAVSRTRQALMMLDDRTLNDIGFTRQQIINGSFFNANDVIDFPAGNLGMNKPIKQDNKKVTDAEAA